ncbi:hypothetical protein SESBI_01704 [Sesbania bispinosa]|nr:hypothetical protein SESBI_01704 [Sesbania bispinosa]
MGVEAVRCSGGACLLQGRYAAGVTLQLAEGGGWTAASGRMGRPPVGAAARARRNRAENGGAAWRWTWPRETLLRTEARPSRVVVGRCTHRRWP